MARLVVGTGCLVAPAGMDEVVGALDTRTLTIVRVLGGRLVLQAGLDVALGARTRRLDLAVELVHAASMVSVAVTRPAYRRPALVSAAVASGIAVLDVMGDRGRRCESRSAVT